MTTQAFELQAVSDEELQAANGGATSGMPTITWPPKANSSVSSGFRGQSSGTPGLGDSNLNAAPTGGLPGLG